MPKRPPKPSGKLAGPPRWLFPAGAIVGGLVLLALAVIVTLNRTDSLAVRRSLLSAQEAAASVARIDETLTLCARMAAQTGERRWRERFEQNLPLFTASADELARALPPADAGKLRKALSARVAVERRANALSAAGRTEEARQVLAGDDARGRKETFARERTRLARRIQAEAATRLGRLEFRTQAAALAALIALGSIGASVGWLLRALRSVQWDLSVQSKECQRAQNELQIARAQLSAQSSQLNEARQAADRAMVEQIGQSRERDARNRLLSTAFENANDVVMITDATPGQPVRVLHVNDAFERMTGYSRYEILGRSPSILQGEGTDPLVRAAVRERLEAGEPMQAELLNYRKDGTAFWVELNIQPVCDENGFQTHWVSIQRDITERKEIADTIYRQSRHDALTGLPNRMLYQERLAQAIEQVEGERDQVGVLFFDLDRFKHINDTLGHTAGDQLLKRVAERIQSKLRPEDTVARIGGDEFTILLPRINGPDQATRAATRLLEALSRPFVIDGHELYVTASIGISIAPHDGSDIEALLKNADIAMYKAKDEGRDSFRIYSKEIDKSSQDRIALETNLRKALEKDEFILHYQPQVDLKTGHIFGAEALIRWQSPTLGRVSPGMFIPIAEETGLISAIGEWAIADACRQAQHWREVGLDLRVSVNLSAREFMQRDIVTRIATLLSETKFPPHLLDIELTEGTLLQVGKASDTLHSLKALGVRLSVDDFGTGYSSLSYLRNLPLDILKVDKSFVDGLGDDRKSEAVVRALIELGHGIGVEIIAEGVETEIQRAALIDMGCDAMQGYLLSPPIAPEAFIALVKTQSAREHEAPPPHVLTVVDGGQPIVAATLEPAAPARAPRRRTPKKAA
jgi:diguanylate cyclase (GGDEF)-like protein/PAS domain S-box-containing protein